MTTTTAENVVLHMSDLRWRVRNHLPLQYRVAALVAKAATDILNEDASTESHWERALFAEHADRDPIAVAQRFMPAVGSNPTVLSSITVTGPRVPGADVELNIDAITDNDLGYIIETMWDETARRAIANKYQGIQG